MFNKVETVTAKLQYTPLHTKVVLYPAKGVLCPAEDSCLQRRQTAAAVLSSNAYITAVR